MLSDQEGHCIQGSKQHAASGISTVHEFANSRSGDLKNNISSHKEADMA